MAWTVTIKKKAAKGLHDLPPNVTDKLHALVRELRVAGPVRGNWLNYSKLGAGEHHCHLSYAWVACWREIATDQLEVYYVGSREGAPY